MPSLAEQFHQDSYLHVQSVFNEQTVSRLAAALDADSTDEEKAWNGGWLTPDDIRRGVSLKARHGVHERHQVWADAVKDPVLLGIVRQCLGAEPVLDNCTSVVKPPEKGQPFPMHQDSAYYGQGLTDYVIVTIYLDRMTTENGPIQFVPGSHRGGHKPHIREGKFYLPEYSLEQSVPVYASPGDITVFHLHTIHGSAPNVSSAQRRTVRVGYRRDVGK